MTKKEFARQIVEMVLNGAEIQDDNETIADDVEVFLDKAVEPRDRKIFAKWGSPEDVSTPEFCWV